MYPLRYRHRKVLTSLVRLCPRDPPAYVRSVVCRGGILPPAVSHYCTTNHESRTTPSKSHNVDLHSLRIAAVLGFLSCITISQCHLAMHLQITLHGVISVRSSPRPTSTDKLHMLPHFHRRPIYLVVCKGSYFLSEWESSS